MLEMLAILHFLQLAINDLFMGNDPSLYAGCLSV